MSSQTKGLRYSRLKVCATRTDRPVGVPGKSIRLPARNGFGLADHPLEFLRTGIRAVRLRDAVEIPEQPIGRDFCRVRTGCQPLGECACRGGEPNRWTRLLEGSRIACKGRRPFLLPVFGSARDFIAYTDGSQRSVALRIYFDDVKSIARFGCAKLRGVHSIIAELFFGELMASVANLAIGRNSIGVKLHLDLDVRGCNMKGACQRPGKLTGRFLGRVQETITTIPVVCENFEQIVVVPFPADSEAVQGDALFAIGFNLRL